VLACHAPITEERYVEYRGQGLCDERDHADQVVHGVGQQAGFLGRGTFSTSPERLDHVVADSLRALGHHRPQAIPASRAGAFAIPKGLDLFWKGNLRYPRSVPLTPFHKYIRYNQIETIHYYSAYPLATSNDVKAAKKLKAALIEFGDNWIDAPPDQFQKQYNALLRNLQNDLGDMSPAPIISMAAAQVQKRQLRDVRKSSEYAAIERMLSVDESRAGAPAAQQPKETADE
jgi:hypothetical protein